MPTPPRSMPCGPCGRHRKRLPAAVGPAFGSAGVAGRSPPSPKAVLTVLDEPACRAITGSSQRAQVVLSELDSYATELARDRNMRRRLWRGRGLAPTGQGSGCQRRYKAFASSCRSWPGDGGADRGRSGGGGPAEAWRAQRRSTRHSRHRRGPTPQRSSCPGGHGRLQAGVVTHCAPSSPTATCQDRSAPKASTSRVFPSQRLGQSRPEPPADCRKVPAPLTSCTDSWRMKPPQLPAQERSCMYE